MPGVADDSAQVEAVLQLAQAAGVSVDHGDVIGLRHQIFGHGTADLTGSQDDDAQSEFPQRLACGAKAPHASRKKSAIVYLPPRLEYRRPGPAMA